MMPDAAGADTVHLQDPLEFRPRSSYAMTHLPTGRLYDRFWKLLKRRGVWTVIPA